MKKCLAAIVLLSLILTPAGILRSADQPSALNYLQAHAGSTWATMGIAALGGNPGSLDYIQELETKTAIELSGPILALTAAGKNPSAFNNKDYIGLLKTQFNSNQLGDAALLNDDIFGSLALLSAGLSPSENILVQSKNFILANQNPDGGFGFQTGAASDSNITAAALAALKALGLPETDPQIQKALSYLKSIQNPDGGFGYIGNAESDADSTSWVLWALNAFGTDPRSWAQGQNNPLSFLSSLQDDIGYFKYQQGSAEGSFSPITTAYAAIAIAGKTLPVKITPAIGRTFPFRIEGKNELVCSGKALGPTALDLVINAAQQCGYTYSIKTTAWGQYLKAIDSDEEAGAAGWLYLINNLSPEVGAANYQLKDGDELLWYYGEFGFKPVRLTLSSGEISTGQPALATVEYFEHGAWQPLAGAEVFYGAFKAATDSNGQAEFSPAAGYYQVFAQKTGYIRSQTVPLKAGDPSSSSVNLSASLLPGSVLGDATTTPDDIIAFTVNPSGLDFGEMKAGMKTSKTFKANNTGTVNIRLEAVVQGDPLFKENLSLNSLFWKKFRQYLQAGTGIEIDSSLNLPQGSYIDAPKQIRGQLILWAVTE